jgi:hypothetical protein
MFACSGAWVPTLLLCCASELAGGWWDCPVGTAVPEAGDSADARSTIPVLSPSCSLERPPSSSPEATSRAGPIPSGEPAGSASPWGVAKGFAGASRCASVPGTEPARCGRSRFASGGTSPCATSVPLNEGILGRCSNRRGQLGSGFGINNSSAGLSSGCGCSERTEEGVSGGSPPIGSAGSVQGTSAEVTLSASSDPTPSTGIFTGPRSTWPRTGPTRTGSLGTGVTAVNSGWVVPPASLSPATSRLLDCGGPDGSPHPAAIGGEPTSGSGSTYTIPDSISSGLLGNIPLPSSAAAPTSTGSLASDGDGDGGPPTPASSTRESAGMTASVAPAGRSVESGATAWPGASSAPGVLRGEAWSSVVVALSGSASGRSALSRSESVLATCAGSAFAENQPTEASADIGWTLRAWSPGSTPGSAPGSAPDSAPGSAPGLAPGPTAGSARGPAPGSAREGDCWAGPDGASLAIADAGPSMEPSIVGATGSMGSEPRV